MGHLKDIMRSSLLDVHMERKIRLSDLSLVIAKMKRTKWKRKRNGRRGSKRTRIIKGRELGK